MFFWTASYRFSLTPWSPIYCMLWKLLVITDTSSMTLSIVSTAFPVPSLEATEHSISSLFFEQSTIDWIPLLKITSVDFSSDSSDLFESLLTHLAQNNLLRALVSFFLLLPRSPNLWMTLFISSIIARIHSIPHTLVVYGANGLEQCMSTLSSRWLTICATARSSRS